MITNSTNIINLGSYRKLLSKNRTEQKKHNNPLNNRGNFNINNGILCENGDIIEFESIRRKRRMNGKLEQEFKLSDDTDESTRQFIESFIGKMSENDFEDMIDSLSETYSYGDEATSFGINFIGENKKNASLVDLDLNTGIPNLVIIKYEDFLSVLESIKNECIANYPQYKEKYNNLFYNFVKGN